MATELISNEILDGGCAMKGNLQLSRKSHRWLRVAGVVLAVSLIAGLGGLVAACGGAQATATSNTSSNTSSTAQAVTTTQTVTTTQAVTTSEAATTTTEEALQIQTDFGVPYVTRTEKLGPAMINVWAPKRPGPWPVVVMVHGGGKPMMPGGVLPLAPMKVAQRGAVVFAPVWWRDVGIGPAQVANQGDAKQFQATCLEQFGEIAAAVRFARATAGRYGGDSENVTLFGLSGGANLAVPVALGGAPASKGALAGAGSSIPESLVILDPDYLAADPVWGDLVSIDPSFMAVWSPFGYLGHPVNVPITVICSGDPGLSRELGDPWAKDSWLAVRDPSGDIRRGLEKLGALSGDLYTNESAGQLFTERLKVDDDTVTYIRLTHSDHNSVGPEDLGTVLDALVPNARE
jgi:acetyl esterase/lipase